MTLWVARSTILWASSEALLAFFWRISPWLDWGFNELGCQHTRLISHSVIRMYLQLKTASHTVYVHAFYYLLDHVARALLLNDLSPKFRAARIRALARLALSGGAVLNTLALVQCHGKSRTIPWQSTQYWYLKQIPACALHHYYIMPTYAHKLGQDQTHAGNCGYDLNFSYPGFHRITDVHGCSCPQSDLWQFMCMVWVLPHPHLYPVGMRTDSPGPRCTPHRRTPMVGCLQMPREPSRRGIQWGRFSEVSEMDCSITLW